MKKIKLLMLALLLPLAMVSCNQPKECVCKSIVSGEKGFDLFRGLSKSEAKEECKWKNSNDDLSDCVLK